MSNYQISKTAGKAAPALITIILVNAIQAALKAAGITLDDTTIWTIATAGLGGFTAFINWIKHRKDKAQP